MLAVDLTQLQLVDFYDRHEETVEVLLAPSTGRIHNNHLRGQHGGFCNTLCSVLGDGSTSFPTPMTGVFGLVRPVTIKVPLWGRIKIQLIKRSGPNIGC